MYLLHKHFCDNCHVILVRLKHKDGGVCPSVMLLSHSVITKCHNPEDCNLKSTPTFIVLFYSMHAVSLFQGSTASVQVLGNSRVHTQNFSFWGGGVAAADPGVIYNICLIFKL